MAHNERMDWLDEEELEHLEPEDEDWLDRAVAMTPSWAISVGSHVVLILIATVMIFSAEAMTTTEIPLVTLNPVDKKPDIEFEKRPDIFETSEIIPEPSIEEPYINRIMEDHPEDNTNDPFDETKGEKNDVLAESKFKGPVLNATIGVGGPAGGGFGKRGRGGNDDFGRPGQPTKKTESAVLAGLRWLARHQNADGSWSADGFHDNCGRIFPGSCAGDGYAEYDAGVTGLSLLAFLGAGYTHLSRDKHDGIVFGDVVKRAIQWIMSKQDSEGYVGKDGCSKYMYNHSVCALALAEAYGLTQSNLFRGAAQKAIDALEQAQNPGMAWRYSATPGDNDTSVTGWAVMALKSADISGLDVAPAGYAGALAWLDSVTEDSYYSAGYTAKGTGKVVVKGKNEQFDHHESMTAVGMMCRAFIAKDRKDPRLNGGAQLLMHDLPVWSGNSIDFYYWYYASLAMFQIDSAKGPFWTKWNEAMSEALVMNIHPESDGCQYGSWDTVGRWCFEGGRVYATAINVLSLEVYYRYDNVFVGNERK